MQIKDIEQTFERIKPNRKLNKLSAVDYEESKRKVKSNDRNRRKLCKIKRTDVDII